MKGQRTKTRQLRMIFAILSIGLLSLTNIYRSTVYTSNQRPPPRDLIHCPMEPKPTTTTIAAATTTTKIRSTTKKKFFLEDSSDNHVQLVDDTTLLDINKKKKEPKNKVKEKKKIKKEVKSNRKSIRPKTNKQEEKLKPGTTIVISTNYMPSLPSTEMIDSVIRSLTFLKGLPPDSPMIIAVDGVRDEDDEGNSKNVYNGPKNKLLDKYVKAIKRNHDGPHTTIFRSKRNNNLLGNMYYAIQKVKTEYIYVLQHDLPFINEINHTALLETLEDNPNEVRLVRFPTERVLTRNRDQGVCNEDNIDFKSSSNGLHLTKTHTWSDRNHLTRKSYYDEMFTLPGWKKYRAMEFLMKDYALKNCSYWGSYLYGKRKDDPTIFHLDGRRDGSHHTSTVNFNGNLTGLPIHRKREDES